jgi:hypothetical protein
MGDMASDGTKRPTAFCVHCGHSKRCHAVRCHGYTQKTRKDNPCAPTCPCSGFEAMTEEQMDEFDLTGRFDSRR